MSSAVDSNDCGCGPKEKGPYSLLICPHNQKISGVCIEVAMVMLTPFVDRMFDANLKCDVCGAVLIGRVGQNLEAEQTVV